MWARTPQIPARRAPESGDGICYVRHLFRECGSGRLLGFLNGSRTFISWIIIFHIRFIRTYALSQLEITSRCLNLSSSAGAMSEYLSYHLPVRHSFDPCGTSK